MKIPKIKLKPRGKSGIYWVRYSWQCKRWHYSLGTADEAVALLMVANIKAEMQLGFHRPYKQVIFDNLFKRYKQEEWPNKAPSSRDRDETSSKFLLAEFGGKPIIEEQLREQMRAYRTKRRNGQIYIEDVSRKKEVKDSTINREVSLMKRITNLANHEWGLLRTDPLQRFPMFKEKPRKRPITPDEWQRLLSASEPELRDYLIIARYTGIRPGTRNHGILSLTWRDIDLGDWKITVLDSKTGEGRVVYMDETVHKILTRRQARATSKWLFPSKDGNRRYSFRGEFKRAKERAKIINLRIHDLRHAFGTDKKSEGVDTASLSKLMGHKSIKTTMQYGEPNEEHLRKIMKSRPKSSEKNGPKVDQIEDEN